jgi:hypothetical protein
VIKLTPFPLSSAGKQTTTLTRAVCAVRTYSVVSATATLTIRRALPPGPSAYFTERGVDQADVTIGLRKIAQHASVQRTISSASKPTSLRCESRRTNKRARFRVVAQQYVVCRRANSRTPGKLLCRGKAVAGVFHFRSEERISSSIKSLSSIAQSVPRTAHAEL